MLLQTVMFLRGERSQCKNFVNRPLGVRESACKKISLEVWQLLLFSRPGLYLLIFKKQLPVYMRIIPNISFYCQFGS